MPAKGYVSTRGKLYDNVKGDLAAVWDIETLLGSGNVETLCV